MSNAYVGDIISGIAYIYILYIYIYTYVYIYIHTHVDNQWGYIVILRMVSYQSVKPFSRFISDIANMMQE